MIAPNTLLQNRYLVREQIGKGGMGLVYVATDQRFGSTVALKEIFLDSPVLRKAFEREARLLNHLRHPALPRVSDHFTEEEGQFLVMEFIPGADLSQMLKQKKVPFPLTHVLDWADQLLDALEYLHTHEPPIVHRDIKPQNLKLTARNHIVLLDFGLAKGTPSEASRATETASVFGYSFNYAPLEQMQGTGTDPRSDLYSLAATLYHLMTDVTPPDALTRATALVNGEPDPLRPADKVQAQVTAPVARVLASAMAQSAAQRPQTAAQMREALREAAKQSKGAFIPPAIAGVGEQTGQLAGARATEPISSFQPTVAAAPHEAQTVVEPAIPASRPQPAGARRARDNESIVTKVRQRQPSAPQPRLSGRMIGILSGVVLLVVAAAAFYNFNRQPTAQNPSPQTVPSQGDSPTPTTPVVVETQAPALSPDSSSAPTSSQQAITSPNNSQSNTVSDNPNSQPATSDNNTNATQPNPRDTTANPNPTPAALTPEAERQMKAEEIRRQRREEDAAEMRRTREALERQQQMERERERQRREPPPPQGFPPPPPPRREGPPPY